MTKICADGSLECAHCGVTVACDVCGCIPYIGPRQEVDVPQFGQYIEILGKQCLLALERQPHYSDRGNFVATVTLLPGTTPAELTIDWPDAFPRYYFNFDYALIELETWLDKRGQRVEGNTWSKPKQEHTEAELAILREVLQSE